MKERQVVIVVFPGIQSLDAIGPFEVFAGANRAAEALGRPGRYKLALASTEGEAISSSSGVSFGTVPFRDLTGKIDTLLLSGGGGVSAARKNQTLMSWIRATAPTSRRVVTVCTGAFLAAEAGFLDGRRATTHWASAERLAAEFPAIEVDSDPVYIRDGKFWTSAGVTAGIDLALALVQDDLGVEVAQTVARWLVMFLHRPGGQTQFASPVWVPRSERSAVRAVQNLVETTPGGDHRLPAMAAAAAMSVRHFARVFSNEIGETPGRFVERVRLEAARQELENTADTLDVIAARCGFGTAETLRRVFRRRLNVAPDAYRRRFRVTDERSSA